MSLVLLGSTSGSVTLQEPAVAGSTTINLPATSGTMAVLPTATSVLPEASGGTGTTTGYYGFKNRIINGAMVIDQRNAGAEVNPAVTGYYLDRWITVSGAAGKYKIGQNAGSVTPPVGFSKYLGITSLSSYSTGAAEAFLLSQYIEGFNVADFAFGTASATPITLSFWVRSSLTGTFNFSVCNDLANRNYIAAYTINSANTWEQKTISIAGDTSGTWQTNNSIGLQIRFDLGSGSNYNGTAGAWGASNLLRASGSQSVVGTNGATFYITGVQLEKGSTATSFDYRPYSTELQLAQRYCYQVTSVGGTDGYVRYAVGECVSTVVMDSVIPFPVQMRITPSLTTPAASQFAATASPIAGTAISLLAGSGVNTAGIRLTVASGLTTGRAAQLMSNNNNTSYLLFSSEL
jgi:hypothetical protein